MLCPIPKPWRWDGDNSRGVTHPGCQQLGMKELQSPTKGSLHPHKPGSALPGGESHQQEGTQQSSLGASPPPDLVHPIPRRPLLCVQLEDN